jgi:hypothetical protein
MGPRSFIYALEAEEKGWGKDELSMLKYLAKNSIDIFAKWISVMPQRFTTSHAGMQPLIGDDHNRIISVNGVAVAGHDLIEILTNELVALRQSQPIELSFPVEVVRGSERSTLHIIDIIHRPASRKEMKMMRKRKAKAGVRIVVMKKSR